ncbi:hypothetical protein CIK99_05755 [Prevotella sp. P5-92]|uniref:BspA family leucine-rich repeat surface protein n=1 Tax=Prevotella sp. P5-92 TaxID=2024222 RepID=UPI000B97B13A|nr:BspA family leucine-rich repeat surface protein [Prevotella sp. P5-92]OYP57936.1 hypothetical protein CIK99_05755 [Prevotella sp. P5-92]
MTKKRNLTTFMIAIMIMLFSLPANAQEAVGYAQWNESSTTLTFYGGESVPTGAYELNTGSNNPSWKGLSGCTKVVFDESFKDVRPTSCYQWFRLFSKLKTIEGIENLNTEEVTNMSEMFKDCSGLTSLDLSSFNTAKVESMNSMYDGCSSLTSLDLSSFNTAKVTGMDCMFDSCSDLISLDLSSFNTAEVMNMTNMFNGCSGLTTIYVSDVFTIVKVSSSENMFYNCTSLKKGDVSYDSNKIDHTMANCTSGYFTESNLTPYVKWNWDTKVLTFKVANYTEGTNGEYKLNEGNTDPGWCINEVKNNCKKVVFTPSFNHAKPTSCYLWFEGFEQLTTIEGIENLNTEEVTNMSGMFGDCSGLTSLDVSKFNTAEVENMSYMFYICSSLTSLDVSKFNTAKVTDMANMFGGCSSLTSLDLSSFNTAKVENMTNMFDICRELTSLDLSSFNTAKVTGMSEMFKGCSGLTTIYVSDDFKIGEDTNGLGMFYDCNNLKGDVSYDPANTGKSMANYKTGYFTKSNLTPYVKWDANTKVLTFKVANTKEAGNGVYDLNEGAKDPGWSIDEVKNNCTKVVFTTSFNHAKPTSCYKWFNMFSGLTTIQGIENLNTEEVTNMSYMFYVCQNLTELDLSSFNTANVTNMSCMFCWCSRPTSLNLSSFNTAKVENMSYMFSYCSGLTTIYASNDFATGTGTNGSDMFYNCTSLKGAVSYNSGKTGIDMANFDGYFTPKIITPYVKWDANTKVLTFKVANNKEEGKGVYDLNKGATTPRWFIDDVINNCTKVVFTPSFNHAKPTSCYRWFFCFSQLTTIEGIENLNTEEVTDMSGMFNSCSGLTSLGLSSFNTAMVTDMSQMFAACSGLTSLDVSKFNTEEVTDMSEMFWGCKKLTSLNLLGFNTAKVENMDYMFYDCPGLISLDLSSFNTAKVEYMNNMFRDCSGLKTIYVSDDFKIGNGTDGYDMFSDCRSLVGAASYDRAKKDIDMANYKTGYFKTYFTLGENKVELCREPLTTDILNLSGDKDFVAHAPFTANTAKYSRDLSTSGSTWFSLCLPFAYTPNNFTAYQLKGATANAVEIEEITGTIDAGTPVLFKFKDGVKNEEKKINISATEAEIKKAPFDGAKVTGPDGSSLQLCGTYQTKTFSKDADGNAFILLNDKLMNPAKMMLENQNVTTVGVKPFRAYMTLTASAQTSSARAFSIGRGDEGNEGTTAIDLLNSVATDDAEYYDINGRRIDAPAKGVNIVRRGNKTIKLIIK